MESVGVDLFSFQDFYVASSELGGGIPRRDEKRWLAGRANESATSSTVLERPDPAVKLRLMVHPAVNV